MSSPNNSFYNDIFYSKFTIFVCFLVIFVIMIMKITIITIIIIIAIVIIIICIFLSYAQNVVFDGRKIGISCPTLVEGGGGER